MSQAKRILLILGMHRSGTSLLSRICNLLGADIGPDIMPPRPDNPAGFWEHRGIVELNDRILAEMGLSWSDPLSLPLDWQDLPAMRPYRERLKAMLLRDFADADLPCVKDPRLCRLLPLWQQVLDELGWQPGYLLVARNPLEIERSLAIRNGLPAGQAYLLWLRYLLEAERHSRGQPRACLRYEQLLSDWKGVVRTAWERLGPAWPPAADTVETSTAIDACVQSGLRHHQVPEAILAEEPRLAIAVRPLQEALQACLSQPEGTADAFDRIRTQLEAYLFLFDPTLDAWRREGASVARARLEEIARRQEEYRRLMDHHDRDQQEIARLNEQGRQAWETVQAREEEVQHWLGLFQQKETAVAEQTAVLRERTTVLERQARELQDTTAALQDTRAALAQLEQERRRLLDSTSWRVTRPLRWARHTLARLGNR